MQYSQRAHRAWRIRGALVIACATTAFSATLASTQPKPVSKPQPQPEEFRLPLGDPAPARGDNGLQSVRTDKEKSRVLASIAEGLAKGITDPKLFVDHEDLQVEMTAIIRAIVEGDAAPYYDHEIKRGCTFKRETAESLASDRRAKKLLDENADAVAALTDKQLYSLLWESAEKHGFAIHAIDTSQIYFGRGLIQLIGAETWPYDGLLATHSKFLPPSGELMEAEGEKINNSSRSAFIRLRVLWANGGTGLVRINLYYDDGAWRPLSIAIACRAKGWPWPIL